MNAGALRVLRNARGKFDALDVVANQADCGCPLFDFASDRVGAIGGGLLLARALLADLADVVIVPGSIGSIPRWPFIQVTTDRPLEACIGSQYAGWHVQHDEYFAIGSGPARLMRGKEPILEAYNLTSTDAEGLVVLESNQLPGDDVLKTMADECGIAPNRLTVCIARTASLPGTIQIVARSVETTLHKLHELQFDLRRVRSAIGTAPLPPVGKSDLQAIGWTNDAILFGAHVQLWVDGAVEELERVAESLCSQTSPDFGRPFLELFEQYNRDFYRIDRMLFSPAAATLVHLGTGRLFQVGALHDDRLLSSFGSHRM